MHPQSVIHSMVEFMDGSTIAQCKSARHAAADLAGAGLARPRGRCRTGLSTGRKAHTWELLAAGRQRRFPAVRLAKEAGRRAGAGRPSSTPPTRNAWPGSWMADCRVLGIVDTVERVLDEAPDFAEPGTVEDVLAAESWARGRRAS